MSAPKIAAGLSRYDKKAMRAEGMQGLASEAQIDRFVRLGLLTEFDVPTLGGFADSPAVVEMRRLGIILVAHSWTALADEVRCIIKASKP